MSNISLFANLAATERGDLGRSCTAASAPTTTIHVQAELEAESIRRLAGIRSTAKPGALQIVNRVLGPGCVGWCPPESLHGAEGSIIRHRWETGFRIYLANDLSVPRAEFVCLHELAHWHLWRFADSDVFTEQLCDAISAALLCPRDAFISATRRHGDDWTKLASTFRCEDGLAALRYAEIFDVPTALVTRRSVIVRGPDPGWPKDEDQMRRLAQLPAFPGTKRTVLRLGNVLLTAA